MRPSPAGRAASFPFYRATFRLITVVFDIIGYVTDDYEMDISPDDDLKRALLPLWPAEHPTSGGRPSPPRCHRRNAGTTRRQPVHRHPDVIPGSGRAH